MCPNGPAETELQPTAPQFQTQGLGLPPYSAQASFQCTTLIFYSYFGLKNIYLAFESGCIFLFSLYTIPLLLILDRGDTSKYEQTMLSCLGSIIDNVLIDFYYYFVARVTVDYSLYQGISRLLRLSSKFQSPLLDPLLFTFSPPLYSCNIFSIRDLINPLLLLSSYTC